MHASAKPRRSRRSQPRQIATQGNQLSTKDNHTRVSNPPHHNTGPISGNVWLFKKATIVSGNRLIVPGNNVYLIPPHTLLSQTFSAIPVVAWCGRRQGLSRPSRRPQQTYALPIEAPNAPIPSTRRQIIPANGHPWVSPFRVSHVVYGRIYS